MFVLFGIRARRVKNILDHGQENILMQAINKEQDWNGRLVNMYTMDNLKIIKEMALVL